MPSLVSFRGLIQNFQRASPPLSYGSPLPPRERGKVWKFCKDLFLNLREIWSVNQIVLFLNSFLSRDFVEITSCVYNKTIILFNFGEQWLYEYSATIHLDFKVNYCVSILVYSWSDINRIRKQTITSKDLYVYISSGQFMFVAVTVLVHYMCRSYTWQIIVSILLRAIKAFLYYVKVCGHVGVPISSILSCEETPSPQSASEPPSFFSNKLYM